MGALAATIPMPERLAISAVPAVFDCSGALWLPTKRVLVVSDLHFEKGIHVFLVLLRHLRR